MRIDVRASPELLAVIYAMRTLDRTLAKIVRQQLKAVAAPEWSKALARRASDSIQRLVLVNTATITASNQNVRVQSANKGRPLSGGLNPKRDWPAAEFGADHTTPTTYTRTRKGNRHTVRRVTTRGLPARNARGHVFYPAAREMIPRLARLIVQTVVRTIATALEGKQE